MPFPNADGRDYALFPVANRDPTPLSKNGKLYTKLDGGVAQLYFRADDGAVYQITPTGGAVPYPFELPETVDPAPIANTGQLYTKDVAGVSELFFEADDGTITQLTPATSGGGLTSSLVYDPANPTLGNSYATFSELMTAVAAIGAMVNVYVKSTNADASRNAGSYDVSLVNFIGLRSLGSTLNLFFNGATFTGSRISIQSLIIENMGGSPMISPTSALEVYLSGDASIRASGAPWIFNDGTTVKLYVTDSAIMENNGTDVFTATPGSIYEVYLSNPNLTLTNLFTPDPTVVIYDFSARENNFLIDAYVPYGFSTYYGSQLAQTDPPPIAAQQNDYQPDYFPAANVLRLTLTGNQNLTGMLNNTRSKEVIIINADTVDTLTIVNQSAASQINYRFQTNTGANIAVPPNGIARAIYDLTSQRWRVYLC